MGALRGVERLSRRLFRGGRYRRCVVWVCGCVWVCSELWMDVWIDRGPAPHTPFLTPNTHTNPQPGFGDADNIPSRENLHLLRHCQLNASTVAAVDIGGWMPWGSLKDAYRPDHNVGGRRWTYSDPTYWCAIHGWGYIDSAPNLG